MERIKRNWKKIFMGLTVLIVMLFIGLYVFIQFSTYEAMNEARAILNEENVSQTDEWITVEPEERIGTIVFYQGAFVEAESYLPFAKRLSIEGFRVFIPYMPLNLAILNNSVFETIHEQYPSDDSDEQWFIAGHSLGGASAAIFAADESTTIDGVIFLASYPSVNSDLSEKQYPVISITGSNDRIVNEERFTESKDLLPDSTVFQIVEGGNHSNFGYYGLQSGDGISSLSRREQHDQVVDTIKSALLAIE